MHMMFYVCRRLDCAIFQRVETSLEAVIKSDNWYQNGEKTLLATVNRTAYPIARRKTILPVTLSKSDRLCSCDEPNL